MNFYVKMYKCILLESQGLSLSSGWIDVCPAIICAFKASQEGSEQAPEVCGLLLK